MKYAARMLAIAVTMLPLLASAQLGSSDKITTNVPFEFVAGNKVIPAGSCTVQLAGLNSTALMIRNRDANVNLFALPQMGEIAKASGATALVFNKYGDRYFLSAVRVEGERVIYRMPRNKAEAELQASNVPATEEVLLATLK
jgi:hypothetical protein